MAPPCARFLLVAATAAGLACVGEVSSLSGSPCESDLDCPGAYTCAVTSLEGNRTCQPLSSAPAPEQTAPPPPTGTPYYCDEVKPLLDTYCNSCHGANRTPSGVYHMRFDTWFNDPDGTLGAKAAAARIRVRTSDYADMPPKSSPQPTDAERDAIRRWEAAGAPNCQDNPFPPHDPGTSTTEDAGTNTGGTDAGTTTPPPTQDAGTNPTPISYANDIQPIWNAYCTGCHTTGNAAGNLDLSAGNSYAEMVNRPAGCNGGVELVNPNDLMGSMLWRKLRADPTRCGNRMPTSEALNTLDPAAFAKVEQWIMQGAPNN